MYHFLHVHVHVSYVLTISEKICHTTIIEFGVELLKKIVVTQAAIFFFKNCHPPKSSI